MSEGGHANFAGKKRIMGKKSLKSVMFPLRKPDASHSGVDARNGEVEMEMGLLGKAMTYGVNIPEFDWSEVPNPLLSLLDARPFPEVQFGLERVSLSSEDADAMVGYSITFQSDVEDAASYIKGAVARPDATLAAKVTKAYASGASGLLRDLRNVAYDRNLLFAPAWVAAAWRLPSGDHCLAGPPVLLIPDSYMPQLTIDSASQNGKTTLVEGEILQRFCRLLCKVADPSTLNSAIQGLDIFLLTMPEPGYDMIGDGRFGTVHTDSISISGKANDDGVVSDFRILFNEDTYARKRSWIADASFDAPYIPIPEGLRLVASIPRSRLADFTSFARVDYNGGNFRQNGLKNGTVFAPDYSYRIPFVNANSCDIGARKILFNIKRGAAPSFSSSVMSSCFHSDAACFAPDRVLVGLRKDGQETYTELDPNALQMLTESMFCISLFYPDPDAFEFVVESRGVRTVYPLHPACNGAFSTFFDDWRKEDIDNEIPAVPFTSAAAEGELRLESEYVKNLYPDALKSEIKDTGEIRYVGAPEGERNVLMLFSQTGVRMLRLTAKGKLTEVSRPFEGGAPMDVIPTGKGFLFRTGDGVYYIASGKTKRLADLKEFQLHSPPPASLLARLPYAEQLLTQHCNLTLRGSPTIVEMSYHRQSALVKIVTDSGEIFVSRLEDPDWMFVGVDSGKIGKGYLITRPMKVGAQVVRVCCLDLLFAGEEKQQEMVTVLYGSTDMNDWVPLGIGSNRWLRISGSSTMRFFRVLHIGYSRPEGILFRYA